jgi:branched-chain amino acid transport system substrate-binding protein
MSTITTRRWLFALIAVLALVAAACGGGREDDEGGSTTDDSAGSESAEAIVDTSQCNPDDLENGITDDSILIGSSFPQSGTFSAFAEISKGYLSYFDMVNANGGINGRQIEFTSLDDAYESGRTSSNAQRLVEEDEVFALLNVIGTPNNLAIWDQPFMACVPNLFAGTGSQNWGDSEGHPFTIGSSLPQYVLEANMFADYLAEEDPDATVAILALNNDFGEEMTTAFENAVEGTDIEVVATETYESTNNDISSQITTLADTDADAIMLATTALACPPALNAIQDSGWDPIKYISATCTSPTLVGLAEPGAADGLISAGNLIDPRNPEYADVPGFVEFQEGIAEFGPANDADPENTITAYGWTQGAMLADVLQRASDSADGLNRETVMEAAYGFDGFEGAMLLPGVSLTTGPGDGYPAETLQLIQYDGEAGYYVEVGDPVSYEGETADFRTDSYQGS